MEKFRFLILALCLMSAVTMCTNSFAGEIDILLQKLVDKGVLSAGEAQEIKTETQEQVKSEIAQGKHPTLPAWLQTMKFKGDLRARYQYNHPKVSSDASNERHRGRIRLRFGFDSKINDKLLVAAGLCTGTSSTTNKDGTRSTNQSFQDSWNKKTILLDYAYAQYMPVGWLTAYVGKMKNPLWEPGDLVWDTDITPEGLALAYAKKLNSKADVFLTGVLLPIDENSSDSDDATMIGMQTGLNYKLTDTVSVKGAFSYYNFFNIKRRYLENASLTSTTGYTTNTYTGAGLLTYDYDSVFPAVEIGIVDPLKALHLPFFSAIPYFSIFGEYVYNPQVDAEENDDGFMTGLKVGYQKVENWGNWQLRYNFARLEKDAILDILPDSDRYEGQTNIRAHELAFDYGIAKNMWLSLDIYRAQRLAGITSAAPQAPETVVQVDWNMKF